MQTKWKKSPPELIAAFDKAAPDDPRIVRKPMFGYPALFLNGNMFAGTYQDKIMVRLPEDGRAELLKSGGKPFEPMPGRPMKEYIAVPPAFVAKPATLRKWIVRGADYAGSLKKK